MQYTNAGTFEFLMDDKGSTLLAVFGLPPLAHENDATRAVLSSLLICEKLFDLGLLASVVSCESNNLPKAIVATTYSSPTIGVSPSLALKNCFLS